MEKKQSILRTMFGAVLSVFDVYAAVIALMAALSETVARFRSAVGLVDDKNRALEILSVGKTEVKNVAKAALLATISALGDEFKTYAVQSNKVELEQQIRTILRDYKSVREVELIALANTLIGLLTAAVADLADYNITQAKVAGLGLQKTTFETSVSAKAAAVSARMAGKKELNAMFKEANRLLMQELDPLINALKAQQPQFYEEYRNARRQLEYGLGHREEPPAPPELTA